MTDPIYGIGPRASGLEPIPPQGGSGVRDGVRAKKRGRLIAIEGIDGSGKSGVAEAVANALGGCFLSFPNDSAFTGPMIRAYLRREWNVGRFVEKCDSEPLDPLSSALAFQALQIANRMETMPAILRALSAGRDVVLCRYWQSAFVYGRLDGLPEAFLLDAHAAMPATDVAILLDVVPEEGERRRAARDGAKPPERYEGDLARARKIAAMYRELWEDGWKIRPDTRWTLIDASGSLEEVTKAAVAAAKEVSNG